MLLAVMLLLGLTACELPFDLPFLDNGEETPDGGEGEGGSAHISEGEIFLGEELIQEKQHREKAQDIADVEVQDKRRREGDDIQPRAAVFREPRDAEGHERQ